MSKMNPGLFSSDRQDWETPKQIIEVLESIGFPIQFDLAATSRTAKAEEYYTAEDDALSKNWAEEVGDKTCWLNPPYGKMLEKFMRKVAEEADKGVEMVVLVPARLDTRYMHEYGLQKAVGIFFVQGRLHFLLDGEDKGAAPFPSMLLYYGPRGYEFYVGMTRQRLLKGLAL